MRRFVLYAGVLALQALALGEARGDVLGTAETDLRTLETDAQNLNQGLRARKQEDPAKVAERRLVEAQVAYGVGNYADASILLYDVVDKHPNTRVWAEAVFFLADSLYQKKDYITARKYFRVVVFDLGERNAHYQKALERLLELSLINDDTEIGEYLARIDRIPEGKRIESVPYVRGKFAYFRDDYDAAIRILEGVKKGSAYHFQARYFVGAAYIAKNELDSAAKVYHALLREPLSQDEDLAKKQRRVAELSQLALGRIHFKYAQDLDDDVKKQEEEALEAVAHYLMVPRRSDLFDDALYEVAFVYIQVKKFDKALRALELLEMATGQTCSDQGGRVPDETLSEICLLKGNLQIRKAQTLTAAGSGETPLVYASAVSVFRATRDAYMGPRAELEAIMQRHEDPKKFFAQITGADSGALASDVELPPIAVKWVQAQPMVIRVRDLTAEIAEIRKVIEDAQLTLDRMERAVSAPGRVNLDPDLSVKKLRSTELKEALAALRLRLVKYERELADQAATPAEKAELQKLAAERDAAEKKLAALPDSGERYGERVKRARTKYDELEKRAQEIDVFIGSLEAELVAIEKFYRDTRDTQKMPQETYEQSIREIRQLIADLRAELEAIRREIVAATDEGGIDEELEREERDARTALDNAVRRQHEAQRRILARGQGQTRERADRVNAMLARIAVVEKSLENFGRKLDKILDAELADERQAIVEERARLAELEAELEAVEAENVELGSEIIYASFEDVSKSFYEISIRADVGMIDVAWAQKEEAEDAYHQIDVGSRREQRMIDNDFAEVRAEDEEKRRAAEAAAAKPDEAPATQPTPEEEP